MKYHLNLLVLILCCGIPLLGAFNSCTRKEAESGHAAGTGGRGTQPINLFPKDLMQYDNTDKLSWDEAYLKSTTVLHTGQLRKLANANDRALRPFYVYSVDAGSIDKTTPTEKSKFPLLFISKVELYEGTRFDDSVYLFLAPLRQYQMLENNLGARYEWVNNAPFIVVESE